jgi:hypothetical protein
MSLKRFEENFGRQAGTVILGIGRLAPEFFLFEQFQINFI